MTSNISASKFMKNSTVGFGSDQSDVNQKVKDEVKQYLKPELINRIDDIIIFNRLDHDCLVKIAGILVKDVTTRLKRNRISVTFDDDVYEFLVNNSNNSKYGARPIRRSITKYIENKIADVIIKNNKIEIKSLSVSIKNDTVFIEVVESIPLELNRSS